MSRGVFLHNPHEYTGHYACGRHEDVCHSVVEDAILCMSASALGNPDDECGFFGLVPMGKDDNLGRSSWAATMDAYVALIKSGRGACARGEAAYRIESTVWTGMPLMPPFDQDISHVTYCECALDD